MKSRASWMRLVRGLLFTGIMLALSVIGSRRLAYADVRLEGDWPAAEKTVTLDLSETPRARAIELLAEAAGLSVVMSSPFPDLVDVHVKGQPASKVLELLLGNGSYVARRSGNLISIQPDSAAPVPPAPPVAAISPAPPAPSAPVALYAAPNEELGEDRNVFGGSLTLQKGETAHDVAVFGGDLDVYGTVTGDLAVLGGSVHVHDGAVVRGSATVLGGEMQVDDGADVHHEASVVGGRLNHHGRKKLHVHTGSGALNADDRPVGAGSKVWHALSEWGDDALSSLSFSALLFVFGAVIVALATERSQVLRVELAARPMRTLALGVVGALGSLVVGVALCVTIIGIPVALVGAVVFLVAAYAGVSAVLTTVGEALLRHRTTNAYVHLAVGCAVYFLFGLVPWLGKWVAVGVFLAGVGLMVATRGAGLIPERRIPAR